MMFKMGGAFASKLLVVQALADVLRFFAFRLNGSFLKSAWPIPDYAWTAIRSLSFSHHLTDQVIMITWLIQPANLQVWLMYNVYSPKMKSVFTNIRWGRPAKKTKDRLNQLVLLPWYNCGKGKRCVWSYEQFSNSVANISEPNISLSPYT